MDSSHGESFHLSLLHKWNVEFTILRSIDEEEANKPCIETWEAIKPGDSIITLFVETDEVDTSPDQISRDIQEFCPDARRVKDLHTSKAPVALLNDSDSSGRHRIYGSALTANQLYEALQRPRFQGRRSATRVAQNTRKAQSENSAIENTLDSNEPDAERRLIYVANPDQWTVLALAATATYHQARFLRRFIYDHLAFNASIDVVIPPRGLSAFALIFHLPFYALRESTLPPVNDIRYKGGERLLRQYQDITFLSSPPWTQKNNSEFVYLYESQVSCLVSGWDRWTWVAYLFIDLYYGNADQESLDDYREESDQFADQLGSEFSTIDPLLAGQGGGKPERRPREYFLNVFEVRSRKVMNEWHRLVTKVHQDIKRSRESCGYPSQEMSDTLSTVETDGERSKRKAFLAWSNKVVELLTKLIRGLDENVLAWKDFSAGSVRCFYSPGSSLNVLEPDERQLLAIQGHFTEMARLLRRLQDASGELQDITKDLKLRLANENNEFAIIQQATAQDVKLLTSITFHFVPFALVAAFLSTRQGFFPIPETLSSLIISLLILELLVWILLDKQSNWKWGRAFIQRFRFLFWQRHRGQQDIELEAVGRCGPW
ncbi:hypothetical protein BJ170DRAFT_389979 [Xylariales sp. AK1849]|nr:hypothetical protein BJ170DRAFT_389979 [Xylariales sp. AK1849]